MHAGEVGPAEPRQILSEPCNQRLPVVGTRLAALLAADNPPPDLSRYASVVMALTLRAAVRHAPCRAETSAQ